MLREDALLHVMLVDEVRGVERIGMLGAHPLDELEQAILDDLVIILPARVARDLNRIARRRDALIPDP